MIHIILCALAGFFIALGVCDAVLLVMNLLINRRCRSKAVLTAYICDDSEHCEYLLRSAGMAAKLLGSILCDTVIVVDDCTNDASSDICRRYCDSHENMVYSRGLAAFGEVNKKSVKKL